MGRDGGGIDLLQSKDRKTCKMEPDKDSKIEQNESRTHRSKLSRTTGLYQARVQNLSCWGPNRIQMGSIEIHFSMALQVALQNFQRPFKGPPENEVIVAAIVRGTVILGPN